MYKIDETEYNKLKDDLLNWLGVAFEEGTEKRFTREGCLWKEQEQLFDYPINAITIKISAVCDEEYGDIKDVFFDDIEIIDDENNEYKSYEIDQNQTDELNRIIKRLSL